MSAINLIAQLADAAQSLAPARESIVIGFVTFYAEPTDDFEETWFGAHDSPARFCRNADGSWWCSIAPGCKDEAATAHEAFGLALNVLTESLLKLVESRVAS